MYMCVCVSGVPGGPQRLCTKAGASDGAMSWLGGEGQAREQVARRDHWRPTFGTALCDDGPMQPAPRLPAPAVTSFIRD